MPTWNDDHDAGLFRRGPERVPHFVVVAAAFGCRARHHHRLVAERHDALELCDGVVSGERREHGDTDESRRHRHHVAQHPVVVDARAGLVEDGVGRQRDPEPSRGEHQLAPHALLVEVGEAQLRVACARRARPCVGERREGPEGDLVVDVHGLHALVSRHTRAAFGQRRGKFALPEVVGLHRVAVARVRPDLVSQHGCLLARPTVSRGLDDTVKSSLPSRETR